MIGPCMEWDGSRLPLRDGRGNYGYIKIGNNKSLYVHRLALEAKLGRQLLPRMLACHECDNPPCFNPDHLFEGTYRDNANDSVRKGRHKHGPTIGEKNPRAILTDDAVRDIRARVEAAKRPGFKRLKRGAGIIAAISEEYGITKEMVYFVVNRKNWSHIS